MRDAIDALDAAVVDYAEGAAVNRPRSHTYTHRGGARHYLFKTMDGSVPRLGVHALRLSSDLTDETGGKRIKIPAARPRRRDERARRLEARPQGFARCGNDRSGLAGGTADRGVARGPGRRG